MEWIDNISDWRWVGSDNKIFAANPNWFPTLPLKFRDAIIQAETEHADEVQVTIAHYLLDKSDEVQVTSRRYKPVHVLPLDITEVPKLTYN